MKLLSITLVVCFAGSAFAADPAADNKANEFVDQFVQALKSKPNFDPMNIPDHKQHVHQQLGLLPLDANFDLKNTQIVGLSHASRAGQGSIENNNGSFSAQIQLGDSNVKAHSDVTIHLGLLNPKIKIELDIGNLGIHFAVTMGDDGKPALQGFTIDEFTHTKMHVHGAVPLMDGLLDVIANIFIKLFNTQTRDMMTQIVRPMLEEELKKLVGSGA